MSVGSLNSAFTLAFVVTSMFGLGLGLTLKDLLAPLKNVRLVAVTLGINFILIPALAWVFARLLPLRDRLRTH